MRSSILTLSQICCWANQWNNFENWSIFYAVMKKNLVTYFFGSPCVMYFDCLFYWLPLFICFVVFIIIVFIVYSLFMYFVVFIIVLYLLFTIALLHACFLCKVFLFITFHHLFRRRTSDVTAPPPAPGMCSPDGKWWSWSQLSSQKTSHLVTGCLVVRVS